jgi:hypothetical protein
MNFEFAIAGNPTEELNRIKAEAAKDRIAFIGDSKEGTFTGGTAMLGLSINGIYGIAGKRMLITIYSKPSTRSWTQIKTMLKGYIER